MRKLRERIAELETLLEKANSEIRRLRRQLATDSGTAAAEGGDRPRRTRKKKTDE